MTKHMKLGVVEKFTAKAAARPIPLKKTDYVVDILGGLAVVTLTRLFRNEEKGPIEATITFPVPFEAIVTDLSTKVAGRVLVGRSTSRVAARESYEDAIDRGKAAVLHEELLRGLHMVSVANVAPGAEVEVSATFVMPLSGTAQSHRIRIPLTVGQVYGQIPVLESDAILTGGPSGSAGITISHSSGSVHLLGGSLRNGIAEVPLDRPIDIEVSGHDVSPLIGRAADGRLVTVTTSVQQPAEVPLNVEILLDTSGSMKDPVASDRHSNSTKWMIVHRGLRRAAYQFLKETDAVGLWVFSTECRFIGRANGRAVEGIIRDCPFDNGGTELACAIAKVVEARSEANVLLVTDGKSWREIDVQSALATGARFTVVLVGEDSLEMNVGYLAAMSGGQMFIVSEADADLAIETALSSMRSVGSPVRPITGIPSSFRRSVGGVEIVAEWRDPVEGDPQREGTAARVAAYAAGFALPAMDKEQAASFAEAEGIVSHLTSIILVDEEGAAVEGIPSTHKVALPDPARMKFGLSAAAAPIYRSALAASGAAPRAFMALAPSGADMKCHVSSFRSMQPRIGGDLGWMDQTIDDEMELGRGKRRHSRKDRIEEWPPLSAINLSNAFWDEHANALSAGDLSVLPADTRAVVTRWSNLPEVMSLSLAIGQPANWIAIALLARKAIGSRSAARIARSILAGADSRFLSAAEKAIS